MPAPRDRLSRVPQAGQRFSGLRCSVKSPVRPTTAPHGPHCALQIHGNLIVGGTHVVPDGAMRSTVDIESKDFRQVFRLTGVNLIHQRSQPSGAGIRAHKSSDQRYYNQPADVCLGKRFPQNVNRGNVWITSPMALGPHDQQPPDFLSPALY